MTTTLPRAATAPELALTRLDNQSHGLYLTIPSPATIYTAVLAAVPTTTDKVASITYTSGSGTLANVLADMTMLVYRANLSACDIVRIRKDGATLAGTFYVGEESEVSWTAGDVLVIIDDIDLHPRHINMAANGTTPLMDYDIDHTDENKAAGHIPIPIMGQDRVLWLRGTAVSVTIYDAVGSWVIDGTIASYAWVCAGATFDDAAISQPTLTFSAVGRYRVALTVTASNGKTYTGYRYIHVVTEATCTTQFELSGPPSGDNSQGGYSFTVTLYDEATRALVRDRAQVILHSVDYYGNTRGSVGYNTGSENIVCIGRIVKETIHRGTDDTYGSVTFEVQGPQYWFGQMTAFPEGVIDVVNEAAINKWTKFTALNVDKALYHFAMFRTTAARCMDVYPSGDTVRVKRLEEPSEFVWNQWVNTFWNSRRARPTCDRTGRLFLQIDQQLMPSRSAVPTVMAITAEDWYESIDFDREVVPEAGRVDLSGTAWSGAAVTAQFSLAPGHVFKKFGSVLAQDRLALDGVQANTNTLAGLISAVKNNPYKKIDIKFASCHHLFDIAPHMRATLAIAAADSPRGITESLTLIPRAIADVEGNEPGVYYQTVTFEAEVTAALAITGDSPPYPPTPPITPYPPPVVIPPIVPGLPGDATELWFNTATEIYYSTDFSFQGLSEPTYKIVAAMPANFTVMSRFDAALDGSAIYMIATVSGLRGLWQCNNPKSLTPTWTKVIQVSDAYSGHYVLDSSFVALVKHGNTVTTFVITGVNGPDQGDYRGYIYEWNGSIVSYSYEVVNGRYQYGRGVGYRSYAGNNAAENDAPWWFASRNGILNGSPVVTMEEVGPWNTQDAHSSTPWASNLIGDDPSGSGLYTFVSNFFGVDVTTTYKLYKLGDNGGLLLTYAAPNTGGYGYGATCEVYPRGAYAGTEIDLVDNFGKLFTSPDGLVFTEKFTWGNGVVEQAKLTGSGSLVWLRQIVLESNELIRVSNDGGMTWVALTGDFWTRVGHPNGTQTFLNMRLVFK